MPREGKGYQMSGKSLRICCRCITCRGLNYSLNYWGGSSVFICRGLGLHGAHRCKAVRTCHRSLGNRFTPMVGVSHRTLMAWRLLSAIMLLVMGGIHLTSCSTE